MASSRPRSLALTPSSCISLGTRRNWYGETRGEKITGLVVLASFIRPRSGVWIELTLKKFFVTQIGTISPALAEYQNIGAILVKIVLVAFELELLNFCFTRNNVNRLRGKLRITQKIIFSDFEKSNL